MQTTSFYAWTVPPLGADPWYPHLERFSSEIDLTVHSVQGAIYDPFGDVEATSRPRISCIVSLHPTANISIIGTTGTGSNGAFHVLSGAPFGRCVGSFTVPTSGAWVTFRVEQSGFLSGFGGSTTQSFFNNLASPPQIFSRLVVNPGSIEVAHHPALTFTQGLVLTPISTQFHHECGFIATYSMAPGNYSATLELKLNQVPTNSTSTFIISTDDRVSVIVFQALRGPV